MKTFILVLAASGLLQISAHAAGPAEGPAAAKRVLRTVPEETRSGTFDLSGFEKEIAAAGRITWRLFVSQPRLMHTHKNKKLLFYIKKYCKFINPV